MRAAVLAVILCSACPAQDKISLGERARRYLIDLIRIETTNPPGHETRVAEYLRQTCTSFNIASEMAGNEPNRLNFIARLPSKARTNKRPLLLMAHSDVVPADRTQWTVPPFAGEFKSGFIYGRGAQDDKSLLAAELAVLIELKRRAVPLKRDVILLSEADEEADSSGISWLVHNAYSKIDADFALNEGGAAIDTRSGQRIFQIQTAEKIPTRVVLKAKGTAGHGSLPRNDNPVVHLARAIARLADTDEPVKLNTTTRRYFEEISKLPDYDWVRPLLPKLENSNLAVSAANHIRERDPELNAMLRTSVSPTMLRAGMKVNVIPNTATAELDVRRLPNETREEVEARFRGIINDPAVEVSRASGPDMPTTEPSSLSTEIFKWTEKVFKESAPHSVVVPYMSRGATDGAYLRRKGMAVYGVPIFVREGGESRAHGNDERISPGNLTNGTELLWKIIVASAVNDEGGSQ